MSGIYNRLNYNKKDKSEKMFASDDLKKEEERKKKILQTQKIETSLELAILDQELDSSHSSYFSKGRENEFQPKKSYCEDQVSTGTDPSNIQ